MPTAKPPTQPAYIAHIGHLQYGLHTLQDAETLLRLLSAAIPVEDTYVGEPGHDFRDVLVADGFRKLSISLVGPDTQVISREAYDQLHQAAIAAQRARREHAAGATEAA